MNAHDDSSAPADSRIDAAAIGWLIERSEGFTAAREREFAAWFAADERHPLALARLEKSVAVLEELPAYREELEAAFRTGEPSRARTHLGHGTARTGARWLALGGLAAAIAIGGIVVSKSFFAVAEQRYATPEGGRRTVVLEDGSVIELNAATVARVRYARRERRVDLEAGEAHFAVAPDVRRPFVVATGSVAVRAVGTAFDVRRAAGAVEVLVVEGKVQVQPASESGSAMPLVRAGERAIVPHDAAARDVRVEKVDPAAIRAALRWQPAIVEFADEPLRDIVARFNRRNRVQLVLRDPELAARRIAGVFSLDEVEAFVRLLERDGVLEGERRGENEILLRRRP